LIALRAFGLAAIAAAAAVKPAASISRLIAALAILSNVALLEPLLDLPRLVVDLAIAASICLMLPPKAVLARNGSGLPQETRK
jgi:hypothetical protein